MRCSDPALVNAQVDYLVLNEFTNVTAHQVDLVSSIWSNFGCLEFLHQFIFGENHNLEVFTGRKGAR